MDPVYYELCVLNELSSALRSGDIFVEHSKKFCDFENYLLSRESWKRSLKTFPAMVPLDFDEFWEPRAQELREDLVATDRALKSGDLPEVRIENGQVIVEPLKREQELADGAEVASELLYSMVPPIKITGLLLEVERKVKVAKVFTHLTLGNVAEDFQLLYSVILAEGTNLGLAKMAQASSHNEVKKLIWLHEWYVREDTYLAAMAELTNFQLQQPLAQHWGEGTHSSSDGQHFKTAQKAEGLGTFNHRHGREPGLIFYTHVSEQYSPFFVKVIASTERDALHIVDGLLYHQSDLRIEEHTTDTHGFTDPVFAITHLLGFRFAPRIKGMKDHKIFTPEKMDFEVLKPSVGGKLDVELIRQNWEEILRVVTSIRAGHVTASVILAKLSSYSRKNSLYRAFTELGKYYRTLFMLSWWKDPELRRRSNWNLNKGEALNKLKKVSFFNGLGELRSKDLSNHAKRASGLNTLVSMITVWNTMYLGRAVEHLKSEGTVIPDEILQRISPLGYEHINLTGDYVWRQEELPAEGEFLPLRLKKPGK
ncbi:TnpA family transposase [Deinobacterium chartae]|uniref:TnpA family transposase n=1 Tax=Deinobacterium chartae TaxID=521158 RepID=A0A841I2G0_9DEIO|nr:TnpA family transposase [Deinobacterium chartae]